MARWHIIFVAAVSRGVSAGLQSRCYGEFPQLVSDEGSQVGVVAAQSSHECKAACNRNDLCRSFSFCPGWNQCYLKDRLLDGSEPTRASDCKTYYTKACSSPSSAPTPAPTLAPTRAPRTCDAQWGNVVCNVQFGRSNCVTCGERIIWLMTNASLPWDVARQRIADEFFSLCGACGSSEDTKIEYEGYTLVWRDEFDGVGAVDPSKWRPIVAGDGFGNWEQQFYTDRVDNAWVSDGTLKLRARLEKYGNRRFTSAKLESVGDWLYGKIHIRSRLLGAANGTWAAHWMHAREDVYGSWPHSGEIDIMEHVGHDSGKFHATVHTDSYHHTSQTQVGGYTQLDAKSWHTWTVEWRPNIILFAADDEVYAIFRREGDEHKVWPFDQKFYTVLNLAVGGTWGGLGGIDETAFAGEGQIFEVDWVRVEQRPQ